MTFKKVPKMTHRLPKIGASSDLLYRTKKLKHCTRPDLNVWKNILKMTLIRQILNGIYNQESHQKISSKTPKSTIASL